MMRRLAEMFRMRRDPPSDERSSKAVQTEALRAEVGAALDRVDKLIPPDHPRLASYGRVRIGR